MSSEDGLSHFVRRALHLLKSCNVALENGLSESEVNRIESRFGFCFPPDLKALLQTALPFSFGPKDGFPNWRSGDDDELRERLDWPFQGLAFDIENNAFWIDEWGAKPDNLGDAIEIARQVVDAAPKMIPLYSHRYLPAEPLFAGNPVFSVYQTDIIYYGCDLLDYFTNEFAPEDQRWQRSKKSSEVEYAAAHRKIRFWSTLT